jgi:hypothetical protein
MSRIKNNPPPAEKLHTIQVLYMMVYNDDRSLIPLATELFHTLGAILEGVPPRNLDLQLIDKEALLQELTFNGDV